MRKSQSKIYDYLIVGSGLFGSVFGYEASKKGKKCLVIDKRNHIGGNCYTQGFDSGGESINIHKYGAHIFHTTKREIWEYINQFCEFNHFINSPLANYKGEIYNLPFNMNTFAQIFGNAQNSNHAQNWGGGGRTTHGIKSTNDSQESNSLDSRIINSHKTPHSKAPQNFSHTPLTPNFLTPQQAKEIIESQKAKITHTPRNGTLGGSQRVFFAHVVNPNYSFCYKTNSKIWKVFANV